MDAVSGQMMELYNKIREAIAADRVIISIHSDEQLRERAITVWQVVSGMAEGQLICERQKTGPIPLSKSVSNWRMEPRSKQSGRGCHLPDSPSW